MKVRHRFTGGNVAPRDPIATHEKKIEGLEDENYQLQQRVKGLGVGHGSFQLWDVAQQLYKNNIGNGNVHKTLQMLVEHGLLLKDTSVKKRSFYRPFLKDIRAGYFDHELTNNGQPVPVWQSQITVTAKGLDWIVRTFLSLRDRKWERERPMIRYSRAVQCRLADIPLEAGGRVIVADEYGTGNCLYLFLPSTAVCSSACLVGSFISFRGFTCFSSQKTSPRPKIKQHT